jgi:hypothetical protein
MARLGYSPDCASCDDFGPVSGEQASIPASVRCSDPLLMIYSGANMLLQAPVALIHSTSPNPSEPRWFFEWDFRVSIFTLALSAITGWLAWETRKLRKDGGESIVAAKQVQMRRRRARKPL